MSESSQSVVVAPYRSAWQTSVVELIVAIQRDEFGFEITADAENPLGTTPLTESIRPKQVRIKNGAQGRATRLRRDYGVRSIEGSEPD